MKLIFAAILLFSGIASALDCSKIEDNEKRLLCYDLEKEMSVKPNNESIEPNIIHQLVKAKLRDPSSSTFRNERQNNKSAGDIAHCGEVNSKNGFGGYTGFRRFFVYGNSVRIESKDHDIDPTVWELYCTEKSQGVKIGDWIKYNSGQDTVIAINNDNSTLLMECNRNSVALVNDIIDDIKPEASSGLMGIGQTVDYNNTVLLINDRNSRWNIVDNNTIRFPMSGRNMKHIRNMVLESRVSIGNNEYSSNGFKESLIELRKECPGSSWNRHIREHLEN